MLFDYDEQEWEPPKLGKRKAKKAGTPEELNFAHTVPAVY